MKIKFVAAEHCKAWTATIKDGWVPQARQCWISSKHKQNKLSTHWGSPFVFGVDVWSFLQQRSSISSSVRTLLLLELCKILRKRPLLTFMRPPLVTLSCGLSLSQVHAFWQLFASQHWLSSVYISLYAAAVWGSAKVDDDKRRKKASLKSCMTFIDMN